MGVKLLDFISGMLILYSFRTYSLPWVILKTVSYLACCGSHPGAINSHISQCPVPILVQRMRIHYSYEEQTQVCTSVCAHPYVVNNKPFEADEEGIGGTCVYMYVEEYV